MAQKEVIHLTLGTLSQHISTHFFNQQSSHFQYDEKAGSSSSRDKSDDLLLDPNVDFQEGIGSRRNEQTFFPREVVVGFKGQMGTGWDAYNVTLADGNDDGNEDDDDDDDDDVLRPSNAVNEGLHAWSLPAELMRTEAGGRVTRTRTQWHGDDDDDEKELSASEDEGEVGPTVQRTELDGDSPLSKPTIRRAARARYRTPASYAHNALHPRSLHALPRLNGSEVLLPMGEAAGEGQCPFSSFEMGMLLAREMERSSSLTEDSIRWFAEDSDSLQSFHLTTCTSDGFAGITHEVMQSLADEFPKTPVIAWGAQWGHDDYNAEGNEGRLGRQRHMNNILSLWSLSSASLYVPLRIPAQLQGAADVKAKALHHFSSRAAWTDEYQAAALLSAHIDTSTLRMRLRNAEQRCTAASLVSSLNWRRDTPIGCLGGCMPTPALAPFAAQPMSKMDPIEALLASRGYGSNRGNRRDERTFETPQEIAAKAAQQIQRHFLHLSLPASTSDSINFAENVVARDDDKLAETPTREGMQAWSRLDEPMGQSTFVALPYRIQQASFPQLFSHLTSTGRRLPEAFTGRPKVASVPMLSSLFTSPRTAASLKDAQRYVDAKVIKGHDSLASFGLGGARGISAGQAASDDSEGPLGGRDGMIEIRERLEELLGAYEVGDEDDDEELGTDEEYPVQAEEWALDDD